MPRTVNLSRAFHLVLTLFSSRPSNQESEAFHELRAIAEAYADDIPEVTHPLVEGGHRFVASVRGILSVAAFLVAHPHRALELGYTFQAIAQIVFTDIVAGQRILHRRIFESTLIKLPRLHDPRGLCGCTWFMEAQGRTRAFITPQRDARQCHMIAQPCARRAPAFVQISRSAELLTSLAGGAVVQVDRSLVQFKTFLKAVLVIRVGREAGKKLRIAQGVLDRGSRHRQAADEGQMDVPVV